MVILKHVVKRIECIVTFIISWICCPNEIKNKHGWESQLEIRFLNDVTIGVSNKLKTYGLFK